MAAKKADEKKEEEKKTKDEEEGKKKEEKDQVRGGCGRLKSGKAINPTDTRPLCSPPNPHSCRTPHSAIG